MSTLPTLAQPSRITFGEPIYTSTPLGTDWGLGLVEWERGIALDVTGDGQQEVIISTTPEGSNARPEEASPLAVFAWRNGTLVEISAEVLPGPVGGSILRNFVTGDFNNDGLTDLLINNHGTEAFEPFPGERNVLLLADGNGGFLDATDLLPDYTDFSHGSVAADFTGNGFDDLFINNLGDRDSNISYLLVNDGQGGFLPPQHMNSFFGWERGERFDDSFEGYPSSYHAELMDYGGNGIFDIYLGYIGYFGEPGDGPEPLGFAVAVNDGAGNFTLVFDDALAPDLPGEMWRNGVALAEMTRAGDVTGNGLIDLVVYWDGPDLTYLQLLENRGPEGYVDASHRLGGQEGGALLPLVGGAPDFYLTDFDGDGDLDIVLSRWSPDFSEMTVLWFENDGRGNFARIAQEAYPGTIQSIFADVNGDGVPDMVYMVSDWDLPVANPTGLNYAAVRLGQAVEPAPGPTAQLAGTVTDRAGNALSDTTVSFTPVWGDIASQTTSAAGAFGLDIAAGVTGDLSAVRAHTAGDPSIGVDSALNALRLALGLTPSWGPATAMDLIAADFDGNGAVEVADALAILRVALNLPAVAAPRWLFLPEDADLSAVTRFDTSVPELPTLPGEDASQLGLVGILVGHVQDYT